MQRDSLDVVDGQAGAAQECLEEDPARTVASWRTDLPALEIGGLGDLGLDDERGAAG